MEHSIDTCHDTELTAEAQVAEWLKNVILITCSVTRSRVRDHVSAAIFVLTEFSDKIIVV